MRKYVFILLLAFLMAACGERRGSGAERTPDVDTIPMMVMQIQKCSRLYTSEYQIHKIVTFSDTMSVSGQFMHKSFKIGLPMGKRRIAIPVMATVKAYVDFKDFSAKNIRQDGKKIEIELPDPQVTMTSTQIDHEHVKQKVSFFRSKFTDEEITHIQQQGRADILRVLPKMGMAEDARQSAARQLIPIVEQLGYRPEDVVITFRRDFNWNDIPALIKPAE